MLSIIVSGEYMDLIPGAKIQRERKSPLFLSTTSSGKDAIPGEISYPFNLPLSDKNLRLTKFIDVINADKYLLVDTQIESDGIVITAGKILMQSVTSHFVKSNTGRIEASILSNVSEFFKRIEGKLLTSLTLGGRRDFSFTGFNKNAPGFWQHIHSTWNYRNCDDGDYVFFPVINEGWLGGSGGYQNGLGFYGADPELHRERNTYSLCPHVYLAYVIRCIFEENGYRLEGDMLQDADFKQLTLLSFRAVNWASGYPGTVHGEPGVIPSPYPNPSIWLRDHVPNRITISEFLVELCKLLPISFVIDDRRKICKLISINSVELAAARDYSSTIQPNYTLQFSAEKTIKPVQFKQDFGADSYVEKPDFTNLQIAGECNNFQELPTPTVHLDKLFYVRELNHYYIAKLIAPFPLPSAQWRFFCDNIHAPVQQEDAIDINVKITPVAQKMDFIRWNAGNQGFEFLYPVTDHPGSWFGKEEEEGEILPRIAFYRGLYVQTTANVNIPLACNHNYLPSIAHTPPGGRVLGKWSLNYDRADGLINTFWKTWLLTLQKKEVLKGTMNMPLHEYLQLEWGDMFLINNTPYFLLTIKDQLPYNGKFDFEAVRKV